MGNKKVISIGFILIVILFFTAGYFVGKNIDYKEKKSAKNQTSDLTIDVSGYKIDNKKALNKLVTEGSEIFFGIQYNDKYIIERSKTAEEEKLVGKKGVDLESIYRDQGYILKDISEKKVEMVRKPLVYLPNRYVILAENNEIVIAKSDSNGSILDKDGNIINKEGTGTKINSLRVQDIINIIKGDKSMQFESIEQLNDGIKDFDIKYEMPE